MARSSASLVGAIALALSLGAAAAPLALASDDDGKPDSDTWDIEIGQVYGKTLIINAWDTVNFQNAAGGDYTATFLAGTEPLPEGPSSLRPTRDRGTYWDGTDVLNSGQIPQGGAFWATILEPGTFEFYNVFNPAEKGWIVAVPPTKHIPNEGTPVGPDQIAADPALKALTEANR